MSNYTVNEYAELIEKELSKRLYSVKDGLCKRGYELFAV